jgi:Vitamin K-dependent gamma-carboxylase
MALFRIAFGACLIADLLFRIPQIDDFYDDRGALPREAVIGALRGSWAISVHFISGLWTAELALFLLALGFAIGFTLGYRTRLCAVASWFLVMSMQVRSGMVLHGGDDLFRVLLFWCMFVPLSGRFSLDRTLNPDARPLPLAHLSPGSLALIFQVCAMYWYTAAEKMHPVWLTERAAIYYTLSLEIFATPLGRFLLGFPKLLPVLTIATVVLELFGPILVLLPVRTGALRLLVLGTFISFHVGLGLTLRLGLFPWVCVSAWLLFLPPDFWEFLGKKLPSIGSHLRAPRRLPERLFQPPLRPPAPKQDFGLATSVLVLMCLVLTEAALSRRPTPGLERFMRLEAKLITLTQVNQTWRMFAPFPRRDDGWYVMEGVTRGGSRVDVWKDGGGPDHSKPADFGAHYRNSQWQKFLENLRREGFEGYKPYFGRYLCREWNARHQGMERVDTLHIHYMLEWTPPPGQPAAPAKDEQVLDYTCSSSSEADAP